MDAMPKSEDAWAELLTLDNDDDEDEGARATALVHELDRRGEAEVVGWALPLLADPDPWHRQAAAWVLGQHGFLTGRPFGDQVMPALAVAARSERDDDTREYMVSALGHGEDPAWVDELLTSATDPYAPVRETVARSLPHMFCGEKMHDEAMTALIVLTRDDDPHVRDWATFSIGTQSEHDSDAIRAALRARLDDESDPPIDGEAAVGLALRHDPSVYPYLERWLAAPPESVGNLTVEAAGALGDQRLLPALLSLRATDWQQTDSRPEVLDEAIAALEAPSP